MSSAGYQVIARKWRPQKFDDVVGQDHVVRTLKNAIERNRIAHAYLFVGPRGTGKTTTARIFAKCLNVENGPMVDPPEDSAIAKAIMNGTCMDVLEIDGASNNGVEQVRALREDAQYAPSQGKFKVYIIDEVHMLSTGAFNALLKILEEPPAHVKFIFATTEAHKVLPTIVSRCQRFDLKPIPENLIRERLALICKAEGIEADEAALMAVARLADGGMRDSQSILDQMIAFCGTKITEADVLQVYGLVSSEQIDELAVAIATGDHPRLLELSDAFDANGQDFYRALVDLQSRARRALLDAVRGGGKTDSLGATLTTESLTRLLDSLRQSESGLKFGLSEKVNFEVALLKASEECRARAIDGLIRELATLAETLPESDDEKKKRLTVPERKPYARQSIAAAPARTGAASKGREPEEPLPSSGGGGYDRDPDEPYGPTEADLAEMFGGGAPAREEDEIPQGGELPDLEAIRQRVPAKTQVLMEELFRAKLSKVQRVNPKKIR